MLRLLVALAGVILLAVTALAVIWLAGQVLAGLGMVVVGTAGVLFELLWFLIVAGLLGGLVFFVTSAWRPAAKPQPGRVNVNLAGASSAVIPSDERGEVVAVVTADPTPQKRDLESVPSEVESSEPAKSS